MASIQLDRRRELKLRVKDVVWLEDVHEVGASALMGLQAPAPLVVFAAARGDDPELEYETFLDLLELLPAPSQSERIDAIFNLYSELVVEMMPEAQRGPMKAALEGTIRRERQKQERLQRELFERLAGSDSTPEQASS